MKVLGGLFIAGLIACSAGGVDTPDSTHESIQTIGPLRLELRDEPTSGGLFFLPMTVGAVPGAVVVHRTGYGSLCQLAVGGMATLQATKVDLHLSFNPRTAVCPGDFRVLSLTATVSTAPGTYDVTVISVEGGRADTLAERQVTVP